MSFTLCRILFTALLLFIGAAATAASTETQKNDSILAGKKKPGLVSRVINYFDNANKRDITRRPDFSFIGGPHYSSDAGLGLGLVMAGVYSTCPEDTLQLPSNVSIFADASTKKYFKVGIEGIHVYRHGDRRVNYEVSFKSYDTYFWGIGYDRARSERNKSRYTLLDLKIFADHLWRFHRNLFGGPLMELDYIKANHPDGDPTWTGITARTTSLALGGHLVLDTRDNLTYPTRGWLGELSQKFYPRFFGNSNHSFSETEGAVNFYHGVWRGGVIAARLHCCFTYGRTPWGLMPTVGGRGALRGYYEGQYRDKCETDVVVELRQKIYHRIGMAAWVGMGAVYPDFRHFSRRYLLPNAGIGYRWELKRNTNVRLDVGFGKGCWGLDININEAF